MSPRGRIEPLELADVNKIDPAMVGKPQDISSLLPHVRIGAFHTRKLTPDELVRRGAPVSWLFWKNRIISRNYIYGFFSKRFPMTRHNEEDVGGRRFHLRYEERKTRFQHFFHRKLDERMIDFGQKSTVFF